MKKFLSVLLSICMLLSITAGLNLTVFAGASGYYEYTVLDNGTAEITNYTGSDVMVTIPEAIDGYTVTSIGDRAFQNNLTIDSVSIPYNTTTIGESAFYGCSKLMIVTIPLNLRLIKQDAFANTATLNQIYYAGDEDDWGSITIEGENNSNAFSNLNYYFNQGYTDGYEYYIDTDEGEVEIDRLRIEVIGELTIPQRLGGYPVTSIGRYVIGYDDEITSITIPGCVKTIGNVAVSVCSALKTLVIEDGVESIGSQAFYACENLANITIPDSVTSIGEDAFAGCAYISDQSNWENSVLYIGKNLILADWNALNSDYVIKDGTKLIAGSAFLWCEELTGVTIPNSVEYICSKAFCNCNSLKSITIPGGVDKINYSTFAGCTSLENATLQSGVTEIGNSAFSNCENLKSITIPDTLTAIEAYAFLNCTSLTDIYYGGSKSDWNKISIDSSSKLSSNVAIHYKESCK